MSARTLRGKVAVAGIGETTYYKHGKSPDPEFALALKAILRACAIIFRVNRSPSTVS